MFIGSSIRWLCEEENKHCEQKVLGLYSNHQWTTYNKHSFAKVSRIPFLSFAQLIWNSKSLIHRMNTEMKALKFQQNASNKMRHKYRRRNKSTTATLQIKTAGLHTTHVLSTLWTPLWNAIPRDWLRIPKHCSSKFWALNLSEESLSKSCWAALFRLQI